MPPLLLLLLFSLGATASATQEQEEATFSIRVTPAEINLKVGESVAFSVEVLDADGNVVDIECTTYSRNRRALSVDEGIVTALQPGSHQIVVRAATSPKRTRLNFPVEVAFPPFAGLEFTGAPDRLYVGTGGQLRVDVFDTTGAVRDDAEVEFSIDDESVMNIDAFGNLWGIAPGTATLTAEVWRPKGEGERWSKTLSFTVHANPVRSINLVAGQEEVRTGDVVHLKAMGLDENGQSLPDVPISLSVQARPDDSLGNAATGQVTQDGRFVAQTPGLYTIIGTSGSVAARTTLRANPRDVQRKFTVVGKGQVTDSHTSDLWVWEGVDGRDYCVTGTWGADGEAHFWDVTDPANMVRIATIKVDARTVNDVKVSEDGRICILSREGASDRKNGMVILDVTDPSKPEILSTFTDQLTGGVHNVFIYEDHVYALSAGRRFDIINILDPRNPQRVGTFELESEGHSIHDVWVKDGIAYTSNWGDGVVLIDVGNGVAGGSPSNPVQIASYAYPSGWNHAAWPHTNEETGTEYVIAGDEAFPFGLSTEDNPTYARGWLHFIDFTDKKNPQEVARYQVPEAGTHNLWVEDDILYSAFYNGGLRAIDISGELMGDLYGQGREIGFFLPTDVEGFIPNAPMVWGPQPHKGNIFFSDWNSGLWAVKLEPSVGE
jgi:hypothetical protein